MRHSPLQQRLDRRKAHLVHVVNDWIAELFDPKHRADTVAALVDVADEQAVDDPRERLRAQLTDTEGRLRRHEAAIAAGVDPTAFVDAINQATAKRDRLRAKIQSLPAADERIDVRDVEEMVDTLGDMAASLDTAQPDRQAAIYRALNLALRYRPNEHAVTITANPGVVSGCVRGGT